MSEQEWGPAQYAADIDAARDRLIAFVDSCTAERWNAAPLQGDPRPVGVVADHVAHAYEYLAGWMRQILQGEAVTVNSDVVDALNAEHAAAAVTVTKSEAAEHLRRSGAAISCLPTHPIGLVCGTIAFAPCFDARRFAICVMTT